jgi:triacylglycerol esterase/lipase EstA (alpha/beta hydrolase family)
LTNYFISGIASDEWAFSHQYKAIANAVYLPFPKHEKKDTMATYAQKFIPLIDTQKPFNIIAHSMGGIITMELIKHIYPEKIILLSTVKSRAEMPFKLTHLKFTNAHKLLPGQGFVKSIEFGTLFMNRIKNVPGLRAAVIKMAKANDPSFLYWAVNAIVKWNGTDDYRKDIIHIHGTKDEMFPYKNIKDAIPVFNGTHEMNILKADEVNAIINYYLNR